MDLAFTGAKGEGEKSIHFKVLIYFIMIEENHRVSFNKKNRNFMLILTNGAFQVNVKWIAPLEIKEKNISKLHKFVKI